MLLLCGYNVSVGLIFLQNSSNVVHFRLAPKLIQNPEPQWTPWPVCISSTSPNTSTTSSYTWSSSHCGSAADYNTGSTPSTSGTRTSHQWHAAAYWRIIARITMWIVRVWRIRYLGMKTGCEIFFSTMVLQIYYVTSVVPTLWFILRARFSLDPLYSQANWYNGTGQLG